MGEANLAYPEIRHWVTQVESQLNNLVCGQETAIQHMLVGLVGNGHILLEGVPGVAKTLLVRSLAASVRCSFARIQFTPDLMPSDVTGVNVFEPKTAEFRFRRGPLFADLVLTDEINRAPAKTQAALLEAMQEGQVTIDEETHTLSPHFTVIGTQNPIEYEGTYPLPEAQLDRFFLKIQMTYPDEDNEREMLTRMHRMGYRARNPVQDIAPIASPENLQEARKLAHEIQADDAVIDYVLRLIRQSRAMSSLSLGASPRAGTMLLHAAKALAILRGKDYLSPDEIQAILVPTLRHRVKLTPEAEIEGLTPDTCLESLLKEVSIPR